MKQITGKVVGVFSENVSLNIGREQLLTIPSSNFKSLPERGDKVVFSADAVGHKVKRQSGEVVWRSKNLFASNFKTIEVISDFEIEVEPEVESIEE